MNPASHAGFPSTHWSLVEGLGSADPAMRERARAGVFRLYWPAVYSFLRRQGVGSERAGELTQAFFADKVFGKGLFDGARPERCSHLRAFVKAAVKRFRVDDERRRSTPLGAAASLESERLAMEETMIARWGGSEPEEVLDRRWAALVVEEAVRRCEAHYNAVGKERLWRVFEARVLNPSRGGVEPGVPEELARRHGFASAKEVNAAVQTVKRAMEVRLREVIGETTSEVEEELEYLRSMLA